MTRKVRLLLPILSLRECEVFQDLVADALLAPGNLPALGRLVDLAVCVLAPAGVARAVEASERFAALGRHANVSVLTIEELVLDHAFDVVPTLAYQKGIVACGDAATETGFIFLQPNLLLADGALTSVTERLLRGSQVITATYLRADVNRFRGALRESGGADFSPRWLVERAIKCLDAQELASIVNSHWALTAPAGRFFWQYGSSTLVASDFSPSLVALRPSRLPSEVPGFRDVAFAAALCPDAPVEQFVDSDEFLGIELTELPADNDLSLGHRGLKSTARELAGWTTAPQRVGAVGNATLFHSADVWDAAELGAKARAHMKSMVAIMSPPQAPLDQPRWRLGHYLWSVRKFELQGGHLPRAPFEEFFGQSLSAAPLGRNPLNQIARTMRNVLLGSAPRVTFLHPEWLDYRHLLPSLHSAMRGESKKLLYIADDTAILGRVLGPPASSSSDILAKPDEPPRPADAMLELIVVETSSKTFRSWSKIIAKVLPALKPGGRIVLFQRNAQSLPTKVLTDALARGALAMSGREFSRIQVSIADGTAYRAWLRAGYLTALGQLRRRDPANLAVGAALFSILTVLTVAHNAASAWSARNDDRTLEGWSSATIVIEA